MKTTQALLPAAFAAAALAQSSASVSYTTITAYTDVCSGSDDITSTTTATITSQVCAICEGEQTYSGVLTTYTTVFLNVCPTGSTLTPATYTVTEPCPSDRVGQALPTDYMPQGFTTTVASCACQDGSATLTVPAPTAAPTAPAAAATGSAGAPAASGAPREGSNPTGPTPAAGSSAPESPAQGSGSPASGSGSPAGNSPSEGTPAEGGNSPSEGGSTPSEGESTPGDSTVVANGPGATVTSSVNLATNGSAPAGNGTSYTPNPPIAEGAGSRSAFSLCGTLLAAVAVVVYAL